MNNRMGNNINDFVEYSPENSMNIDDSFDNYFNNNTVSNFVQNPINPKKKLDLLDKVYFGEVNDIGSEYTSSKCISNLCINDFKNLDPNISNELYKNLKNKFQISNLLSADFDETLQKIELINNSTEGKEFLQKTLSEKFAESIVENFFKNIKVFKEKTIENVNDEIASFRSKVIEKVRTFEKNKICDFNNGMEYLQTIHEKIATTYISGLAKSAYNVVAIAEDLTSCFLGLGDVRQFIKFEFSSNIMILELYVREVLIEIPSMNKTYALDLENKEKFFVSVGNFLTAIDAFITLNKKKPIFKKKEEAKTEYDANRNWGKDPKERAPYVKNDYFDYESFEASFLNKKDSVSSYPFLKIIKSSLGIEYLEDINIFVDNPKNFAKPTDAQRYVDNLEQFKSQEILLKTILYSCNSEFQTSYNANIIDKIPKANKYRSLVQTRYLRNKLKFVKNLSSKARPLGNLDHLKKLEKTLNYFYKDFFNS